MLNFGRPAVPEAILNDTLTCNDPMNFDMQRIIYEINDKMPKIKSISSLHSINDIKTALTNYGPCLIGVELYNNSSELWKPIGNQPVLGGHALLIVGYDEISSNINLENKSK
jgi:C1A family cysteine protease